MWDVEPNAVQPRAAIQWFRSKLPLLDADYYALEDGARAKAFTVSGLASLDAVQDVFNRVQRALEAGTPFEQWQRDLPEGVRKAWGATSGYRLQTIFDTNIQSAYGAGRYKSAVESTRPYWALEMVLDGRTSAICLALTGTTLPAGDPFWKSHVPPLHFRCRTALITLSKEQAEARGITSKTPATNALEGFGLEPDLQNGFPRALEIDPGKYGPRLWAAYQKRIRRPTDLASDTMYAPPRAVTFDDDRWVQQVRDELDARADEITQRLGRMPSVQDLLDAAGVPNGSRITWLQTSSDRAGLEISITAENEELGINEMSRVLRFTREPHVYNDHLLFVPSATGQGSGARLFGHQVAKARALGFKRIDVYAARAPTMNGYYTWPRFGYDAPLEDGLRYVVEREFRERTGRTLPSDVKTLQRLFAEPDGASIWRDVGSSLSMKFDLDPESLSSAVLNAYWDERRIALAREWV